MGVNIMEKFKELGLAEPLLKSLEDQKNQRTNRNTRESHPPSFAGR